MNYEVVWSDFATEELGNLHSYYCSIGSESIANRIVLNIVKLTILLKYSPYIGPIEPLLKRSLVEYRYLVKGKHKIIYSVDESQKQIRIADVFDTRQNPIKINRSE